MQLAQFSDILLELVFKTTEDLVDLAGIEETVLEHVTRTRELVLLISAPHSPLLLPTAALQSFLDRLYTLCPADPLYDFTVLFERPKRHFAHSHTLNVPTTPTSSSSLLSTTPPPIKYATTALGGTFDHLHPGHKILLTIATALTTTRIIVGITAESLLVNKKYARHLESIERRTQAVHDFVKSINPRLHIQTPPINDIYGPTATDPDIDAIIVSEETRSGGQAVNEERAKQGLSQLEVVVVSLLASTMATAPTLSRSNGSHPTTGQSKTSTARMPLPGQTASSVEGKMGSTAIRKWMEDERVKQLAKQGA